MTDFPQAYPREFLLASAKRALEAEDAQGVEASLAGLVAEGDLEACELMGTALMLLSPEGRDRAIVLLSQAAHGGRGCAAHNLASLYSSGPNPDREQREKYFQLAYELGFEATVSADPLWWKDDAAPLRPLLPFGDPTTEVELE